MDPYMKDIVDNWLTLAGTNILQPEIKGGILYELYWLLCSVGFNCECMFGILLEGLPIEEHTQRGDQLKTLIVQHNHYCVMAVIEVWNWIWANPAASESLCNVLRSYPHLVAGSMDSAALTMGAMQLDMLGKLPGSRVVDPRDSAREMIMQVDTANEKWYSVQHNLCITLVNCIRMNPIKLIRFVEKEGDDMVDLDRRVGRMYSIALDRQIALVTKTYAIVPDSAKGLIRNIVLGVCKLRKLMQDRDRAGMDFVDFISRMDAAGHAMTDRYRTGEI